MNMLGVQKYTVKSGHPRRPNTIPGTASPSPTLWGYEATRRRHTSCCAPYDLPSAAPSSRRTDDDSTEDFNTPPSKSLLGGHRACHDAPPEARFARTVVHSVVLCTIPPQVAKTVRHACKLPPPWPIKGGAIPWPQGDYREHSPVCFLSSPRYWHLPQPIPLGPGGPASSPASLVAPLCRHYDATQYSAPSTPLLDVRPRPEPG
jgi:hypothetical protein